MMNKKVLNTVLIYAIMLMVAVSLIIRLALVIDEKSDRAEEGRREFANFLAAVEKIAGQTKDAQVKRDLEFIKKTMFLAVPYADESGKLFIKAIDSLPEAPYQLAFVVLFPEHREMSGAWQEIYDNSDMVSFRSYKKNIGLITIKLDSEISDYNKGLALLHEVERLRNEVSGYFKEAGEIDGSVAEELNDYLASEYQMRIAAILGGKEYMKLVEKATVLIENNIKEGVIMKKGKPFFRMELIAIFGPPRSIDDQMMREEILRKNALVNAYDKEPEEGYRKKYRI